MSAARRLPTLRVIAGGGFAHTFFGQLYEAVVDVPVRISESPQTSLSGAHSPTWYFLPAAPLTRLALAGMWFQSEPGVRRRALVGASAAAVVDAIVTVYLIKGVNPLLFVAGQQVSPSRRQTLLRRWYRLNWLRLAAEAVGWAALHTG